MPHYRSNAEEIRFYAKELLQDGQMHTRDEITQYVKAHSPNADNFTEGMFTGAIRDLVRNSNGAYINPVRGHYQRAPQSPGELAGQELRNKITGVLNDACEGLERACTINIIGLPAEELAIATKVAEIISMLRNNIHEIESM